MNKKEKKSEIPHTLDAIMLSEIDAVVNAIGEDYDDELDLEENENVEFDKQDDDEDDENVVEELNSEEKKAYRVERIRVLKQLVDAPKTIGNGDITPFAWKHPIKIPEKRASKLLRSLNKEALAREHLLPAKAPEA